MVAVASCGARVIAFGNFLELLTRNLNPPDNNCTARYGTMAEDIKEIKRQIWKIRQDVDREEKLREDWVKQLGVVQGLIEADPNNPDLQGFQTEVEGGLEAADATLEPLLKKLAELEAKLPKAPEPVAPKFDPATHPLLKKALEKNEPAKAVVFNTGDICEAQWNVDKQWYKAKIQTILGSASAPKYHVRFLDYDETATIERDNLRPLQSKRKRDPDPISTPAATPTPNVAPVTSTPHVISGPASINPNAQAAKHDLNVDDAEPKKRKIPNKKQLEKGVNSWKNWNSKGVGKKLSQKDSMFRSGTNAGSRVGFTGSGGGMTETHKRVRYDNKAAAEADEEEGGSVGKKRSRF